MFYSLALHFSMSTLSVRTLIFHRSRLAYSAACRAFLASFVSPRPPFYSGIFPRFAIFFYFPMCFFLFRVTSYNASLQIDTSVRSILRSVKAPFIFVFYTKHYPPRASLRVASCSSSTSTLPGGNCRWIWKTSITLREKCQWRPTIISLCKQPPTWIYLTTLPLTKQFFTDNMWGYFCVFATLIFVSLMFKYWSTEWRIPVMDISFFSSIVTYWIIRIAMQWVREYNVGFITIVNRGIDQRARVQRRHTSFPTTVLK